MNVKIAFLICDNLLFKKKKTILNCVCVCVCVCVCWSSRAARKKRILVLYQANKVGCIEKKIFHQIASMIVKLLVALL